MTLYILAFSQHLKFLHSFHHESLSGLTRERKENKKVISFLKTRVENFLGFEFLVRNEEIDGHSHEERGIFEESFSPIFTYIFSYICYQKGAQLFPKKPPYFWNTIFDPQYYFYCIFKH